MPAVAATGGPALAVALPPGYDPGDERTGLVGGTGGPCVGWLTGALISAAVEVLSVELSTVSTL